jgi:hypothetical protein
LNASRPTGGSLANAFARQSVLRRSNVRSRSLDETSLHTLGCAIRLLAHQLCRASLRKFSEKICLFSTLDRSSAHRCVASRRSEQRANVDPVHMRRLVRACPRGHCRTSRPSPNVVSEILSPTFLGHTPAFSAANLPRNRGRFVSRSARSAASGPAAITWQLGNRLTKYADEQPTLAHNRSQAQRRRRHRDNGIHGR